MNKLLNRFAWGIAIALWLLISMYFWRMLDLYWFGSLWVWIPLILLVKKFYLWEDFIEKRLKYFAEAIVSNESPLLTSPQGRGIIQEKEKLIDKDVELVDNSLSEEVFESREKIKIVDELEIIKEKPQFQYATIAEEKLEKVEEVPWIFDIYMEKIGEYIKDFFATNTLAKIWWILIFLAVIYFLKWVAGMFWEAIWSVWRLLIGFVVWFTTFGIGTFIYSRWNKNEGLILMGLSILINYSVILSWRYLIWENISGWDWFLTEGITFILLILNTIFWVITSLVYNSRTLLIFSFVFAYLNPFIIGASSNWNPYTLVWYSLIVSFWGLFLSKIYAWKEIIKQKIYSSDFNILLLIAFILWNILILMAPFSDTSGWIIKMISSVVLSAITIYTFWNNKKSQWKDSTVGIVHLFLTSYVFVFLLLLIWWWKWDILNSWISFLTYIWILLWFFAVSISLLKNNKNNSLLEISLFIPLLLFLWILLTGQAFSWLALLIVFILSYLMGFVFLQKSMWSILSYVYFILMWIFIFASDFSLLAESSMYEFPKFITLIIVSFVFLFSTYYFSRKKWLSNLYSIWTIWTILILFPIIITKASAFGLSSWDIFKGWIFTTLSHVYISVIAIIIFALSNWILPFMNKNILEDRANIWNLIIWSLAWVLFIAFQIYNFWEAYFPWIAQWLAFGWLAVVYFIQSYFIVQKIWTLTSWDSSEEDSKSLRNIFYSYAGISLSLFSLAIAFVFSDYPEIISTVWLFEATILYYFYSQSPLSISPNGREETQTWETKLLIAWNILFAIGIFKLGLLLDIVHKEDYKFLVSFGIIAASLILNIRFIDKIKSSVASWLHYILHIIWIWVLGALLSQIIISNGHGWSTFWISAFILILGFFYSLLKTDFLKWFFVFILWAFALFHIGGVDYIFGKLSRDEKEYLKVLQYIVSWIVIANYFVWKKSPLLTSPQRRGIAKDYFSKIILVIVSLYSFIISNIYILDIFEEIFGHFSLTIYWGVIASVLLFYGIAKDIIKFRTIGLYFIMLTSAKIFLYDVWMLWNTSSRVVAFMWLGILFIAISTFYTKRYGNNILGELSLDNLKDDDIEKSPLNQSSKTKPLSWILTPSQEQEAASQVKSKKQKKSKVKSTKGFSPLKKKETKKLKKTENSFMEKLENVNIDNVKVVRFIPKKSEKFTIRAKNLMRVSQLVIKQTWKTSFKPKELNGIYNYVIANYKSNLSRREYDKLRTTLKQFIDEGGEVEIVKK